MVAITYSRKLACNSIGVDSVGPFSEAHHESLAYVQKFIAEDQKKERNILTVVNVDIVVIVVGAEPQGREGLNRDQQQGQ